MLTLPPNVRIFMAPRPVDMRKGFDGLAAIVTGDFKRDPLVGDLFVFVGRRLDRVKVLFWDNGGFVLYYKRLERGRFQMPRVDVAACTVSLEAAQLTMLLSGFDLNVSRLKKWSPPKRAIDKID